MKAIIFLSFSLCPFSIFAQTVIRGTLCSQKLEAIPYVSIQLLDKKIGTDADIGGRFELTCWPDDSLLITCIGYRDTIVSAGYFTTNDTLFLSQNAYTLDEIVLGKSVIQTDGIADKKFASSVVSGTLKERLEVVTKIEIPQKLKKFRINRIFIKARKFDGNNPIRLHIYSINDQGMPEDELLKQSVILTKNNFRKGLITVDVTEQNINLDGASFFVGIQWITDKSVKWPTGPEIVQTLKEPRILSYYRSTSHDNYWYSYNFNSMVIYPDDRSTGIRGSINGNPLNMCASAEIEIYQK